jgi:hypothetical protein
MRTRHLCGFNIFYTLLILLGYLSVLFTSSSVSAHSAGESYIYLGVYEDKLTGVFHIALRDLNNALGLQTPDVKITEDNLADRISEIHSYYEAKVQFLDEDNELPIRFTGLDMLRSRDIWALTEFVIVEDAIRPEVIGIDYNVLFDKDPEHVALLVIKHFWNAGIFNNKERVSLAFGPDNRRQQLSFSGHSVFTGFMGVVKLGIGRLWSLWKGIDHILFIIALVLPAAMVRKNGVWRPVTEFRTAFIYMVKVIALFTIAHSVTLSIAALGLFSLPNRLVESIIAISIAVAALDIIFPIFKRKIGWVVFIFGLIHGFGFASDLARSGALSEHLFFSLLGFNLGVEIGQVLLVGFMFLNVYLIRQYSFYYDVLMRYSAIALILLGMYWTVDRAFRIGFLEMVAISLLKLIK